MIKRLPRFSQTEREMNRKYGFRRKLYKKQLKNKIQLCRVPRCCLGDYIASKDFKTFKEFEQGKTSIKIQ